MQARQGFSLNSARRPFGRFVHRQARFLTFRVKPIIALGVIGVLLAAMLPGCSPVYFLRAAYEEGKILWRREPIAAFIQNPDLKPDTQEKLRLVLSVREYARDVLKFNVGGSYSSYSYVDRPDLTYIVLAAPKTELRPYTWWFLIVGSVPYKGYFSKEEAQAEIDRLNAEGYDTSLRTSAAFSTLGWFDDPLLSHLLRYDKVLLSEVVFHELFHNTLYVKGAGAFNESSANFAGHRAAIDFFKERFGADSAEHRRALQLWDDEREFGSFIAETVRTLSELYGRDIARESKLRLREEVFARVKADWARRISDRPGHRFQAFGQQALNNAVLMHYRVYLKDLDLFESIYEACGRNLVKTIDTLRAAAAKGGEPFEAMRTWLAGRGQNQATALR
jgi:predicted aminopeptidase